MKDDLPTIRQMRYLLALQEHGGYGAAAKSCGVSQSTVSSAITDLECRLGTTLVTRRNGVTSLTDLGGVVADQASRILQATEALVDACRSRKDAA